MPISRTPIQPVQEPVIAERTAWLPFDPLLALATLGLCVCSLVTLNSGTRDDIPGQPHYYVDRQALYFGVGAVLMVLLSRLDYARLRELKYGLYAALFATIILVLGVGRAARGSQRAISLPSSPSRRPSWASCC